MGRVDGKVAVVTGAALGLGHATSTLLAKEGAKVAVTDILAEEGHQLVKEINASGGEARYWNLDTSDEQSVSDAFEAVVDTYGRLDVLVNNAGISGVNKPTDEITLEEWNRVISINLTGVFLCTKHAIPYLRRSGGGSIVNLSSIYGLVGAPDAPPYHAAKGGVRLMSKTDALLYAADNIRVNSVHPGFIWTPMVEHFLAEQGDLDAGRKALDELHPLGHVGQPEDIAYGILYLASDESKFVTGSELVIDGGYTAR
ncbi:MAG TPA: glucose 1-dehydrogenase [Acidimicrobiales bacterium]|nr:glucose 1-dehydrogenase [Acidimicrobiales bacterium]